MSEQELQALWAAPESELLDALGSALLGDGLGFGVEDPSRRRRFAETWLADRMERIRERVCTEELRAALDGDLADRMIEAAVVADAVATLCGKPAANVLAIILLRRGTQAICGEG